MRASTKLKKLKTSKLLRVDINEKIHIDRKYRNPIDRARTSFQTVIEAAEDELN